MPDLEPIISIQELRDAIEANRRTSTVKTEEMSPPQAETRWGEVMQEPWALACQAVLGSQHPLFRKGNVVTTGKIFTDGGLEISQRSGESGINRSIRLFGSAGPDGIAASISTIDGPVLTDFVVLNKGQVVGAAVGGPQGLVYPFKIEFPPKVQ